MTTWAKIPKAEIKGSYEKAKYRCILKFEMININ